MSRKTCRFVIAASLLAAGLALLVSEENARAADGDRFAAHLAAGEFGPARKLAEAAGAGRDGRLADLAAAQAAAGARLASIDTAALIQDDRVRSQAAQQIASDGRIARGGGGGMADFTALIDLITSTVAPETWDDVGGPGSVEGFEGGVYVDADGVLRKVLAAPGDLAVASARREALGESGNRDYRLASPLRKVSLTRLERQTQLTAALGYEPDDVMRHMAGITKIEYVFVYPETGDIVIAGPAGDWRASSEGRAVSADSGRPVLHLDDFVVLLQNAYEEGGRFGCSITPRKENLAKTQAYLNEWAKKPLKPGQRTRWLAGMRDALGRQDIEVYGIGPRTRAGRVLVEADYRMKLVGMGLEEGVLGVESYLANVKIGKDGKLPPMDVIRWWFTLNYTSVAATKDRDGFELRGQGVRVLSENELLKETGERVPTGKSDELTAEFAHSFTKQFKLLADKYPVYAELRNVFDLALVAALIRSEDLAGDVDWHRTYFTPREDALSYRPALGAAPTEVETVVNHRVVGRRQVVAGVSGGVKVDTRSLVTGDALQTDDSGAVLAGRNQATPPKLPATAWWWD